MSDRQQDAAFVRKSITEAIKRSDKSREQIADEMSALLGKKITSRMITSFTSESKEFHRWPAEYDIAFCEVIGDYTLLADRVRRAGFRMIGPKEERFLKIGRAYTNKQNADRAWRELDLSGTLSEAL